MKIHHARMRRPAKGVAAVEFALIASIFFTLLIGIMEMGRVLFYMNTASEVTRMGARLAVVCDVNSPVIKKNMKDMMRLLGDSDIQVVYSGPSSSTTCTSSTCESVTVSVSKHIDTVIPFVDFSIDLPSFSTTLPRESLRSDTNPLCS